MALMSQIVGNNNATFDKHRTMLKYSPLLTNICVRQVALDKLPTIIVTRIIMISVISSNSSSSSSSSSSGSVVVFV